MQRKMVEAFVNSIRVNTVALGAGLRRTSLPRWYRGWAGMRCDDEAEGQLFRASIFNHSKIIT